MKNLKDFFADALDENMDDEPENNKAYWEIQKVSCEEYKYAIEI